jgi:phosphonate dehydrogenase
MLKIVVANRIHDNVAEFLAQHCDLVVNDGVEPWTSGELRARCDGADGLLAFMTESIDRAFLDACPSVKVIACALKGFDNFDVAACRERGVVLTYVPDLLTAPTAELAVGLMIAVARNIVGADRDIRANGFHGWRPTFYGTGLDGSSVGIVGAGAVGQAIARRLGGFRCHVNYHDANRLTAAREDDLGIAYKPLTKLAAESEFVVLALPLTGDTLHIADDAFIRSMKPGSFLVNPARGSLVDEAAVAKALESGHLAGYAADVFECEDWARDDRPAAISDVLRQSGRTVLTPHIGSAVNSVRRDIEMTAASDLLAVLEGRVPAHPLET